MEPYGWEQKQEANNENTGILLLAESPVFY